MTYQPPPPPSMDAYGNPIPADAKSLALFSHLSSLLSLVISVGSLSFLGPLIFWLVYKDKPGYGFVRVCSAGAFNFNLALWVVNVAAGILAVVTLGLGMIVAVPIWFLTSVAALVFHIIGAVRAQRGEIYRYPFQIRALS